jgi:hypothetical protein
MDSHDSLSTSYLLEWVEGSWLARGSVRAECMGDSWDPVVLDLWEGEWKGEWKEEWRKGWKEWREEGQKEQWGEALGAGC